MQDFKHILAKSKLLGLHGKRIPNTNIVIQDSDTLLVDRIGGSDIVSNAFELYYDEFLSIVDELDNISGTVHCCDLDFIYLKDDKGNLLYLCCFNSMIYKFGSISIKNNIVRVVMSFKKYEDEVCISNYELKEGVYLSHGSYNVLIP